LTFNGLAGVISRKIQLCIHIYFIRNTNFMNLSSCFQNQRKAPFPKLNNLPPSHQIYFC
jgi:hypothetical protein